MRPTFQRLLYGYPKSEKREVLFGQIGWSDIANNTAFLDTCAIRMSIGLLRAGVTLPGARMKANAGPLKGRRIEPGQAKLSHILKRSWGEPEIYTSSEAAHDGIGGRSGVVSFFRIHGGSLADSGHIDLVWPLQNGFHDCARSCYFKAVEFWFWPLN